MTRQALPTANRYGLLVVGRDCKKKRIEQKGATDVEFRKVVPIWGLSQIRRVVYEKQNRT